MSSQTSLSSGISSSTIRFATLAFAALALGACVVPDLASTGRPCSETVPCGPGTHCSAPPQTCVPGPAPADAGPDTASPDARVDLRADLTDAGGDVFVIIADAFAPPGPWVSIPPGSFTMGSPPSEACRPTARVPHSKETQHKVTLTHGFEIMALELTGKQHEEVMGYKASKLALPQLPVMQLSWHEAAAYCNELSLRLGLKPCYVDVGSGTYCAHFYACGTGESCILIDDTCRRYVAAPTYGGAKIYDCPAYRLPTDAEWEYAYRAGTTTALYNGKELAPSLCGCKPTSAAASAIAWYCGNYSAGLKVGGPPKLPNAWGLYNMAGNISEWVHDPSQADLGSATVTDPVGVGSSADHIIRGGSYDDHAAALRAAKRDASMATNKFGGLRCVRTLKP
jgi:formylglycine-generating enzyme required for sulfatase activity